MTAKFLLRLSVFDSKAYHKDWAEKNPEKVRANRRKHRLKTIFGITPEQFWAMAAAQEHRCAICGEMLIVASRRGQSNAMHLDHDHATKIVRGILCGLCNRGLGHFKDNQGLLLRAAAYLKSKEVI
jgi:hypothetical protein